MPPLELLKALSMVWLSVLIDETARSMEFSRGCDYLPLRRSMGGSMLSNAEEEEKEELLLAAAITPPRYPLPRRYFLLAAFNCLLFLVSLLLASLSICYYNSFWIMNADLRRASAWCMFID